MVTYQPYFERYLFCSFLFLLFIPGLCIYSHAQPNFRIVNWTVNEGLSEGTVHQMLKDATGFLWIATDQGVDRFDGTTFKQYVHGKMAGGKGFRGSETLGMVEDSLHHLWIGTEEGLNRYLPALDSFQHFPTPRLNVHMTSYCMPLAATGEDVIALEHTGNIVAYNIRSLKRRVVAAGITWPSGTYYELNQAAVDKTTHTIWLPYDSKILRLQPPSLKAELIELPGTTCRAVLLADSALLIGTSKGLVYYDPVTQTRRAVPWARKLAASNILSLEKTGQNHIWIGTEKAGLYLYVPQTNQLYNYRTTEGGINTLSANKVSALYCDRDGVTWANAGDKSIDQIFPFEQGIVAYNQKRMALWNHAAVRCFAEDGRKKIWIGTIDSGLLLFDPVTQKFSHPIANQGEGMRNRSIHCLKFDAGRAFLLIGTDKGLLKMDTRTQESTKISFTDAGGKTLEAEGLIQHIVALDDTTWLIAGEQGVFTLPVSGRVATQVSALKEHVFFIGAFGNRFSFSLWDYDPVLYSYNGGKWKKEVFPFDDITVGCIIYDAAKRVYWVGTDQGLIMTNSAFRRLRHFTTADGLPDNFIWALINDASGNLWITTNRGIACLDHGGRNIRSFALADGIQGLAYNPRACLLASDQTIYLGGKQGFDRINPASFDHQLSPATVYLANLKVNNKEFPNREATNDLYTLKLTHRQNNLELATGVIDFYSKGHSMLRYKLEPIEHTWQEEEAPHLIRYAGLSPGTYTLHLAASDSRRTWNSPTRQMRILILPPYWQRWWFISLVGLLALVLVYQLYYYRINQLKTLLQVRTKISQDLHDEVGATLSGIAMYSHLTKRQIAANQLSDVQKSLDIIQQSASEMVNKLNDIVWIVNPQHDSLVKLIKKLEEYALEMGAAKNMRVVSTISGQLAVPKLSMEARRSIYLLCKEAINNAVKYSKATQLEFSVRPFHQSVAFTIRDNGEGFDTERVKKGNGLQNMQKRAEEMGGTLVIQAEANRGTTVCLHYKIT
jgi:sugar lactone lactonase YvrE